MIRTLLSVVIGLIGVMSLAAPSSVFAQPAPPPIVLTDISGGGSHTCAVTSAGGVWCWGDNADGQLGDGTTTDRTMMVKVQGLASGVAAVTAGRDHTCALTTAGGVKCWGENIDGQLGDGTTTKRLTPVDVSGLTSGIVAVSAGFVHTCALTSGGGVKCWGANVQGTLGDGSTTKRLTPVDVTGLTSGIAAVSGGVLHTCAVTNGGGLKCWGFNSHGQVGDGGTADRLTPVDVSGLTSGVTAVSAGSHYTCAVVNGGAKCWGDNSNGKLGDGTMTNRLTPVDVSGLTSGVVSVSAGFLQSFAVTSTGGAKSWGQNFHGSLGIGTHIGSLTPVDVSGLASGVVLVSAGDGQVPLAGGGSSGGYGCALTTSGEARCWGTNNHGQLGDGTTTERTTPVTVVTVPLVVQQPASVTVAGARGQAATFTVAVKSPVPVTYEWELSRTNGTTWLPATTDIPGALIGGTTPTLTLMNELFDNDGFQFRCVVTNEFGEVTSAAATLTVSTIAITTQPVSQTVYAGQDATFTVGAAAALAPPIVQWQVSTDGGASFTNLAPAPPYSGVNAATLTITNVTAALHRRQYRAVASSGAATAASAAATLNVLPIGMTQLAAGASHTCAVTSEGAASCWGNNGSGQVGDGTSGVDTGNSSRALPHDVVGLTSGVAAVAAGFVHTCALTTSGGVKCWGSNQWGQIGDGTRFEDRLTPVDVSGLTSGIAAVSAGRSHTCAVTTIGGVTCWGLLGNAVFGGNPASLAPVDVPGLPGGITAVAAGWDHTCALSGTGAVMCWGLNDAGQLGDGTTTTRTTPVSVTGLTSGVAAVTAGEKHTCALLSGGGLKCWGRNVIGTLGDGTTTNRLTPVDVTGLTSGVAAVSAGGSYTCALMNGGGAKCWGSNSQGQLGDGTTTNRLTAVDVIGLPGALVSLATGQDFSCGVASAGVALCWGNNLFGQLGDGNTFTSPATPVTVLTSTGAGPAITVQPIDRSIGIGQSTTFTVTAPSATSYRWLVSPAGATWWTGVFAGSTHSGVATATLTVTNAPASLHGNRYRCVVANAQGTLMSATATLTVASTSPTPPFGLVASTFGAGRIWLTWVHSSTATSYNIKRGLISGGETLLTSVASPGYVDTAVAEGQTYYYVVSAVNPAGESANSSEASAIARVASAAATPFDFDGDGKADPTLFRPSSGEWLSVTSAVESSTTSVVWGLPGDAIVPGDYDGDRIADPAVYRPSNGLWFILPSTTGVSGVTQWGLPGDVPVPGDNDHDGKTDLTVYRPSNGLWYVLRSGDGASTVLQWGLPGDVPVPADYDGDGTTDLAVYRPSAGAWYILKSSANFTTSDTFALGVGVDRPVPGDYDGDGKADPAIFRPFDQTWRWLRSAAGYAVSNPVQWGLPLDAPVPADYDGDGAIDIAVYRRSAGGWFIRRSSNPSTPILPLTPGSLARTYDTSADVALPVIAVIRPASDARRLSDVDGDGQSDLTVFRPDNGTWYSLGSAGGYTSSAITQWGLPGDIPVAGDYDSDGLADRAVFRPSNGVWYVLTSSSGFMQFTATQWGLETDTPVPGDYDGDSKTDPAIYRPATGAWYLLMSSTGASALIPWGLPDDVPVPADYDGDGRTDLAVYRPQSGQWFILTSSSNFTASQIVQWGLSTDVPVPGDYDGDARTDLAVFRPSTGVWYILMSSSNYAAAQLDQWGMPSDVAVPVDYDGDGRTDLAVYRPSTGEWFVRTSSSGFQQFFTIQWGLPTDVPIARR